MNKKREIMDLQMKLDKLVDDNRQIFDKYNTTVKFNNFHDHLLTEVRNDMVCLVPYTMKATTTNSNTFEKVEEILFSLNSIYMMSKKYAEDPIKTLDRIFYHLLLCLKENVYSPSLAVKL